MKIKLSLTTQIATALVLAVIAGVLLQGHPGFVNEYIKPFGTIFLNLLKFIVVPLVLFSIMAGILSMNDMSKLGKLGLRAVLYFAFTTVIAVTMGLVVSTLVRGWIPAINLHIEKTGGSLALMAMVFASANIPVECVAVAAGIDRIIDMGRTVMSVTGDASCAVVMQKITQKPKKD